MRFAAALTCLLWLVSAAQATAPRVLHTPGYESPVRGDPDDLLMIAGVGFRSSDRVVYQAMDDAKRPPSAVPAKNTAESGIAPVIQHDNPPYALTVRLPMEMQKGRAYRLWVVTKNGEWSEPVAINDPRPQWVTPSYVYSTADLAGLGRVIRVVGRNLAGAAGHPLEIRLEGPNESSYTLTSRSSTTAAQAVENYVATATLPKRLSPGSYSISVRRKGLGWIPLTEQRLVREAASIAALCEVAEESAGGGNLTELRARLVELRETDNPEGIEEAESAAASLADTLQPEPRLASAAYLDAIGSASRRLELALGESGVSPFAAAMQSAMAAVEEVSNDVERNYKVPLS